MGTSPSHVRLAYITSTNSYMRPDLVASCGSLPMPRLGRYELGKVLGEGGAGRVHQAERIGPGGFRMPVALEILHRGGDELRREARIGGLPRAGSGRLRRQVPSAPGIVNA
jgi:hypothetical protein